MGRLQSSNDSVAQLAEQEFCKLQVARSIRVVVSWEFKLKVNSRTYNAMLKVRFL